MADRTKPKHSKVKKLKCIEKVDEMLLSGFPPSAVAKFIQEEGEYLDVKRTSLVTTIYEYREKMGLSEVVAIQLPHWAAKKARTFADRLEDLQRLDRAYSLQEQRVDIQAAEEIMSGKRDDDLSKEIRALVDIPMKMHRMRMDLGLSGSRDLGTLVISPEKLAEIEDKYGPEAAKTYANPVSRGRILQAVNLAIERAKLLEQEGVPLEDDEEIEYADYEEIDPDEDEESGAA